MAEEGEVRFSQQYIGKRCRKLADVGIVQYLGNGVYRITAGSEEYLTGELDPPNFEELKE